MEKPQENTSPDDSNLIDDEKQSPWDLALDKSWSPSPVATLAMGCDTNELVREKEPVLIRHYSHLDGVFQP